MMDTHKKIREHISALADGELSDADLELALAALLTVDGQQAWKAYHHIGDVLRAAPSPELSDGFAAQLAARLAAEQAAPRRAPAGAPAAGSAGAATAGAAHEPGQPIPALPGNVP